MRTAFSIFIFGITLLFFVSCQKEIADTSTNTVTGNFKAKIDGVYWVADKAAAATRFAGLMNISGISFGKKTLTITLTDSGVHKYILTDNSAHAAAWVDSSLSNVSAFTTNQGVFPAEAGGEVNVTLIDTVNKTVSGNFFFKVYRQNDQTQKSITEGSFTNIPYSTTLPPAAATDTFKVKINGTLWNAPSVLSASTAGIIAINGNELATVKTVGILCPATVTPGSYNLDFFGGTYIGLYNPDADPMHSKVSTSGNLTILEHNPSTKRIRGNFNFVGIEILNPLNTAVLTEGYFSVTYF